MKVLYTADELNAVCGRGLKRSLLETAIELAKLVSVDVLTSGDESAPGVLEEARATGLSIVASRLFFSRQAPLHQRSKALGELFAREPYDVIHVHGYSQLVPAAIARLRLRQRPKLVFTDHDSTGWRGLGIPARIGCLKFARPYYIALSTAQERTVRRFWNRVTFVPNGVDLDRYCSTCRESRRSPFVRILFPARLDPLKGHCDVFDACAWLQDRGHNIWLVCPGEGPNHEFLKSYAQSLGLGDRVAFPGRLGLSEMLVSYAAADIGVFASYSEMMPLSVLEMMSSGLPVVAYRVGGVPDVIDDGLSGTLVPVGDRIALREALAHYARDPATRHRIGEAARKCVEQRFGMRRVTELLVQAYRAAVA